MLSRPIVKYTVLLLGAALCFCLGIDAVATSGVGAVASTARQQLGAIAQLITAGSYVAGMGFAVGAVVKFKAHKDNPTQIPIGMPIALLFVAAALIFIPSVYSSTGASLFSSGQVGGISGVTSFSV